MEKLIIVTASLITVFIGGCNRNSSGEIKFVKCLIDGVQWEDDGTSYINKNTNVMAISGSTTEGILVVAVKNVSGLGTYDLTTSDGTTTLSFQRTEAGLPVTYSIMSSRVKSRGSITVNKVNAGTSLLDYIEGTFSGVAYSASNDSIVITNGQFAYSK